MPGSKSARASAGFLTPRALALVFLWFSFIASRPTVAQSAPPEPTLRVTGIVERHLVLHDSDLQKLPRKHVAVTDEKGNPATYDGIAVADILRRAGAPLGKQLRGPQLRLYIVANAADGYRVVYALPEFDPDFVNQVVILADRRDGHPISSPEGPFRLVVPGEKRHARWVREVTSFDVEQAR